MAKKPFKPINFGRYLLTDRIAVGGMAEIFYAKYFGAMGFEKGLVIKRILPQFAEDAEFLRMFITEAKLVSHLEHPNIVQINDFGEIDGQYYIAMQYVDGIDGRQLWRTLAKRKQRLPGVLALHVVSEFLKGLDYAHRAIGPDGSLLGVVHRDVSPSNILISFRGDAKIADFGIALVQQESKTQAGVLKGKYGYMSPEQVAGMPVDHRSDIFAAAIVLTELLLGRRLFLGKSDFETLDKVMNVKLDILDQHAKALPPEVVAIARKGLTRDPNDRYQSARDFHDDIMEFLFARKERITGETLAAFITEHVRPYLKRPRNREDSDRGKLAQSPILPSGIVPSKIDKPAGQFEDPKESLDNRPTSERQVDDRAEATPQPVDAPLHLPPEDPPKIAAKPWTPDQPAEPASAQSDQPVVEQAGQPAILPGLPDFEPASQPVRPAPPASLPLDGYDDHDVESNASAQAHMPLWDNVIESDAQFGAIPVLELDDSHSGSSYGSLDLAQVPPRNPASNSVSGEFDAGTEFDLTDHPHGPEAHVVAPPAMLSARLAPTTSKETGRPDFAGKLSNRTVAKVLFRFCAVGESGLLTLTGPQPAGPYRETLKWLQGLQSDVTGQPAEPIPDECTSEILLDSGVPTLIAADRGEESLVAYMLDHGDLERRDVEQALRNHAHRGLVAALLSAGKLVPLKLTRHITAFVHNAVLRTFGWTRGRFTLHRGASISAESFPVGMTAYKLIRSGIAEIEAENLDKLLGRYSATTLSPNHVPSVSIEMFEPDDLLYSVYRSLGREGTIDELLRQNASVGERIEIQRALLLLIECEFADLKR